MAVVMLVLLATILGSMAIASRTTSGLQATRSQSSNREARDIAESGVTEIISELNKEQNRKLLILPTSSWNNSQTNPCGRFNATGSRYDASGNLIVPAAPTSKALGFDDGNWSNLGGNTSKQYRLISAIATSTAPPASGSTTRPQLTSTVDIKQFTGQEKTLMLLTVSGRLLNGSGQTLSTATITREYEVVPKCCKMSFGMNTFGSTIYGEDTRSCFAGLSGGLGVVVGVGSSSGVLNTSSNTFGGLTDQNGLPITRILCSSASNPTNGRTGGNRKTCNGNGLTLGASISVQPTSFTTKFPCFLGASHDASGNCPSLPRSPQTITLSSNENYLRINSGAVEKCDRSSGTLVCAAIPTTTCELTAAGDAWCNLAAINNSAGSGSGRTLTVDTSNGKINFYYTANSGYFSSGNTSLEHVHCAAGTATTPCTTAATLNEVEDFNILINGNGTFTLQGTSSALAINVFNLNGTTEVNGGGSASPNFIGRIWTNSMTIKGGSVSMVVPVSSPSQFCNVGNPCPAEAGGSPSVDWVARSITQSSNF